MLVGQESQRRVKAEEENEGLAAEIAGLRTKVAGLTAELLAIQQFLVVDRATFLAEGRGQSAEMLRLKSKGKGRKKEEEEEEESGDDKDGEGERAIGQSFGPSVILFGLCRFFVFFVFLEWLLAHKGIILFVLIQ